MVVLPKKFNVNYYHSPSLLPPFNCIALQANDLDERYNQTLQKMLVKYTHQKKEVWDDFLDTCVYAYNTFVHETAAFSTFELMFGQKAVLPIDLDIDKYGLSDILRQKQEYNPEGNVSSTAVERMMQHHQHLLEAAKANIGSSKKGRRNCMTGSMPAPVHSL